MTLVITDGEFWCWRLWLLLFTFMFFSCFLFLDFFKGPKKGPKKKMVFIQLRIQFQINTLLTSKLYASGNSEFKQNDCNYMIKKGL
ncbi:TPA: hypothetical protein MIO32_08875 [Klebsiella variicola]|nr:hypothetical protein [Klebsiella variicola]